MANPAPAFALNCHMLQRPLTVHQYSHILQADNLDLAGLSGSDDLLRVLAWDESSPKDECAHLYSGDPRGTASLSVVQHSGDKSTRTKRSRGPHFPSLDQEGKKKVNQGYGGDLSFQPADQPVICKQSCRFTLLDAENDWFSKREVRQSCSLIASGKTLHTC